MRLASAAIAVLVAGALAAPALAATFSATTPLPDSYHRHSMAAMDGVVYHLAGLSGSTGVGGARSTFAAAVLPGGGLGAWTPGALLPEPVFQHGAIAHNGFVYVLGGQHFVGGALGPSSVVYVSAVGEDGSLGEWQETTPLAEPSFSLAAAAWQGRIYVSGGFSSAGLTTGVYSAPMLPGGSLGAWRAESPLPEATYTHAMVAGGSLVVLGGIINAGGDLTDAVYEAPIGAAGALGAWSAAPSLPQPLSNPAAAAVNGQAYVLGGYNGSAPQDEALAAAFAPDGLGSWTPFGTLPSARYALAAAVAGDYLYASGGIFVAPNSDVWYTELSAPIPEPQTYALLLAGLGLLGFAARRRARRHAQA